MRINKTLSIMTALAIASGSANPARALPPPPTAPFTLWNFLGIPQGMQKIKDATVNKKGNHPNLERKPPLKAIADAKNLESPNPAIKKAAEIKSEEDLAPQKIKAIKYLSTIGCGCYPGVKEALLDALDDCTEAVRYNAALAIQDATTQHCQNCKKACCCDKDIVMKLAKMAYEQSEPCCYKEPSERVRQAAAAAMRMCCANMPAYTPIPIETIQPTPEPEPRTPLPPTPEGQRAELRRTPPVDMQFVSTSPVQLQQLPIDPLSVPMLLPPTQPQPVLMPPQMMPADVNAELGPSSRRNAADRGLAAPVTTNSEALETVKAGFDSAPPEAGSFSRPWPAGAENAAPKAPIAAPGMTTRVEDVITSAQRANMAGIVVRVRHDQGTVELNFKQNQALTQGERLRVTREYLLDRGEVGYLEVVSVDARVVVARPLNMPISKFQLGDDVAPELMPVRAAQGSTAAAR